MWSAIIFMCTTYFGRPDLNECTGLSIPVPYEKRGQCELVLAERRKQGYVSDGDGYIGSVKWHRWDTCVPPPDYIFN